MAKKTLAALVLISLCALGQGKDEFVINFNNVDIRTFIKFVSDITGENYALDRSVAGTVTIYSPKAVPLKELDRIFGSVLHLYGYAVIKREGVNFIVPVAQARTASREVNVGPVPPDKFASYLTQVIPLKYCAASSLVQVLTNYLAPGGQISADDRTNSLFISDIGVNISRILDLVAQLDTALPPGKEEFKVYRLENSNSEDTAKVLNEILSKKRSFRVARGPGMPMTPIQPSVVSVKATNSLIVYADPEDFDMIGRLVQDLDVMIPQVYIEALIAEVTFENDQALGIEWKAADELGSSGYTGSAELSFSVETAIPEGLKIGIVKGTTGIGGILKAYAQDTHFNILSTPQIITADNQEAKINVSENRPFLKETRFVGSTTGTTGDTIRSFDYKDVGIILTITPQISKDRYVRLKISQEVTKVLEQGTQGELTTAKRAIDTTVLVPNRQTIVLGGLLKDDKTKQYQKVPLLGDIPLLGWLFRSTKKTSEKTNLLIFITPRIISSFDEVETLRAEKEPLLPGRQK